MVLSPLRASIATLAFIVPLKFFRILVIGFHLFNQSSTKRLPTLNACLNFGVHYTDSSSGNINNITFYNKKLNDEQKKAVLGALNTPHCYFIQGPGGTGKSTVICEIIEQLINKGERILMLAPTHVAVD